MRAGYVAVECSGRARKAKSAADLIVRVEPAGNAVVISPILGAGDLCRQCWFTRRIAALNVGQPESDGSLFDAFEAFCARQVWSGNERQRVAVLKTLRRRLRAAAGPQPGRPFPPHLAVVDAEGDEREEPVLPLPECPHCSTPPRRATAGNLDGVIGPAAGIVTNLRAVPALPGEPAFPHTVVTRLANSRLQRSYNFSNGCSGKGPSSDVAYATAVAESIERYAAGCVTGRLLVAGTGEMTGDFVDPARLAPFASRALRPDEPLQWAKAYGMQDPKRSVHVPAWAVYLRPRDAFGNAIAPANSNGLACAPSLTQAVAGAFAEIIERHVFFAVWYGLRKALSFSDTPGDDPATRLAVAEFNRCGIHVRTVDLGYDSGVHVAACVCWPYQQREARPRYALGLGTGDEPNKAAWKAVLEMGQVYRGLTWALKDRSLADRATALASGSSEPDDPYDHGLLHACRGPQDIPAPFGIADSCDLRTQAKPSTSDWREAALVAELTPADVAAATGWSVVRVVLPEAIPYHWGTDAVLARRKFTGEDRLPPHPLN